MTKKKPVLSGLGKQIFEEDAEEKEHPLDNLIDLTSQTLHLKLEQIGPNPEQPRKHFDENALNDLAQSIIDRGLLQPILVKRSGDGEFLLVAGERRFRAYQKAKELSGQPDRFAKIPAIVRNDDELEISLIENMQREDLNPIEEAEGLALLAQKFSYTHRALADKIKKPKTYITETIELNKLPEEIKGECRASSRLPKSLLLTVAKQQTPEDMLSLWEQIKEGGLTVQQARKVTKTKRGRPRQKPIEVFCSRIDDLSNKLEAITIKDLDALEKSMVIKTLSNLKTKIDDFLRAF